MPFFTFVGGHMYIPLLRYTCMNHIRTHDAWSTDWIIASKNMPSHQSATSSYVHIMLAILDVDPTVASIPFVKCRVSYFLYCVIVQDCSCSCNILWSLSTENPPCWAQYTTRPTTFIYSLHWWSSWGTHSCTWCVLVTLWESATYGETSKMFKKPSRWV